MHVFVICVDMLYEKTFSLYDTFICVTLTCLLLQCSQIQATKCIE